jgi:hypothetical protein
MSLGEKVIAPAVTKARELEQRRKALEDTKRHQESHRLRNSQRSPSGGRNSLSMTETQINPSGGPGFVRQCQRRKERSESGFTVGATFASVFDEVRIHRVLSRRSCRSLAGLVVSPAALRGPTEDVHRHLTSASRRKKHVCATHGAQDHFTR